MKVSEAMTPSVDLVDPSANVQEAATRMAELDVGAILVGAADRIEGILTDRDIIVRVVVEGKHPAEVVTKAVMTPDVVTCEADDEIESAFAAMREGQFRRMPVLDDAGKPVGIVTMSDLARHVESPEKVAEKLREISEPHRNSEAPKEMPEASPEKADAAGSQSESEQKAAAA